MEDSRSTTRNPTPPPPPPPPASLFPDTAPAAPKKPSELSSTSSSGSDDAGRERLKRHRDEVAGKVKIPDKWGQEQMMKDWIEFSTFDALLGSHRMIIAARDALIADARKAKSRRLRIQSSC
ncbi:protein BIC2-like [Neltuma alba]|uniref:protein BIC2-like n=1 Tax=Neltuma alba TaxID=207710 RepID=UPI0010A4C96C|nr:protein BIC2-like [Prosopis alba]XP_028808215.1 protein BIC2-like [Prosopis alba]